MPTTKGAVDDTTQYAELGPAMTDREKIDLKEYLEGQFADVRADIAELRTDVGDLKADKLKREGRDSFLARAGKISVAAITAFGAAIGAFLGLKNNL